MNRQALEALAVALETAPIPADQFDMNRWSDDKLDRDACGFAGCAIGWGWKLGKLPDGLELRFVHGWVMPVWQGDEAAAWNGSSYQSIADAYGISESDAQRLFDPDEYLDETGHLDGVRVTTAMVAERIRTLRDHDTSDPAVVRNRDELRELVTAHGRLSVKYDSGNMPLLDSSYIIVGWLGGDLTPADLEALNPA